MGHRSDVTQVSAGFMDGFWSLAKKCAATASAVLIAWICCNVGRSAAHLIGAPSFQLAMVAVVADAVGSCIQRMLSTLGKKMKQKANFFRSIETDAKSGTLSRPQCSSDSQSRFYLFYLVYESSRLRISACTRE